MRACRGLRAREHRQSDSRPCTGPSPSRATVSLLKQATYGHTRRPRTCRALKGGTQPHMNRRICTQIVVFATVIGQRTPPAAPQAGAQHISTPEQPTLRPPAEHHARRHAHNITARAHSAALRSRSAVRRASSMWAHSDNATISRARAIDGHRSPSSRCRLVTRRPARPHGTIKPK